MTIKTYMIVTNVKYELPVAQDLIGAAAVAEYLGLSVNRIRKNLCSGKWNHKQKYKAVAVGSGITDSVERKREYSRRYQFSHDRTEYFRQYYRRKKEGVMNEKCNRNNSQQGLQQTVR